MKQKYLEFMLAWAEVHNMQNETVENCYKAIEKWLVENTGLHHGRARYWHAGSWYYCNIFMIRYKDMKKYNLDAEIQKEMSSGLNFFQACAEWDI